MGVSDWVRIRVRGAERARFRASSSSCAACSNFSASHSLVSLQFRVSMSTRVRGERIRVRLRVIGLPELGLGVRGPPEGTQKPEPRKIMQFPALISLSKCCMRTRVRGGVTCPVRARLDALRVSLKGQGLGLGLGLGLML